MFRQTHDILEPRFEMKRTGATMFTVKKMAKNKSLAGNVLLLRLR